MRDAWLRLRGHRVAAFCVFAFAAIAIACAIGPVVAGALGLDGTTIDTRLGASPPSWSHWFGTDTLGRDMLVRVLIGGRIALVVALVTTSIALVIGVSYGAVAGFAGGAVDNVMMRFVDVLYGFPTIVFIIVVMAVSTSRSLVHPPTITTVPRAASYTIECPIRAGGAVSPIACSVQRVPSHSQVSCRSFAQ